MDMTTLAIAKTYTNSQRLAHVEKANVIFPETSFYGYAYDASLGFYKAEASDASLLPALIQWNSELNLIVGKGFPFVVEFDGVVYHTKAVKIPKGICVGNVHLAATNQADTGEPFCFLAKDTSTACFSRIEGDSHTLKILDGEDTIHPIDPKYLPGVCLPVVELSTTVTHGAWFTAEENVKLKAAYDGNTPVVIKCNITVDTESFGDTCAVWARIGGAVPIFSYSYGAAVVGIASQDGGNSWLCLIEL